MLKSGPNPVPPGLLSPMERRQELCQLLALGLLRMRLVEETTNEDNELTEQFRLHNRAKPCGRHHDDQGRPA